MMLLVEPLESRQLLSGVTILTHGYNGSINTWVAGLANAIAERAGGTSDTSQYTMIVNHALSDNSVKVLSLTLDSGSPSPLQTHSGEIIVKLDWSQISSGQVSTRTVGDVVADFLMQSHAGLPPLADLPIHLIGHSRGASLNVEIANRLGAHGIWVDQQTFLDPHPVDGVNDFLNADFGDVPMSVGDNVIFADNYWRTNGQSSAFDFNGESVKGAHNQSLAESVQKDFVVSAHESVPAYYHGTIDFNANSNGEEPIMDDWYDHSDAKPARDGTGFVFSRIAGGARPADGLSVDHGGSADRVMIDATGEQWANLADVKVLGGPQFQVGQNVRLSFTQQDRDSSSKVEFFLDTDRNPLNGVTSELGEKTIGQSDSVNAEHFTAITASQPRGKYFIVAKVIDSAGNVRYEIANHQIKLVTATEPSFTRLTKGGTLTIVGTSDDDALGVSMMSTDRVVATRNNFSQIFDVSLVKRIQFDGGDGNDTITVGSGVPGVYANAGSGNDTLNGGDGNDTLSGGAGKNVIYGNGGDDRLNGSGSLDTLFGGAGNDRLYGNGNSDHLDGGDGIDRLFGGSGNDVLTGGSSNDKLYGEVGNDTLDGGKGHDILDGGGGIDTAITDGLDVLIGIAIQR
jgi:Ca2+-binding RTX toxin-like protein